MPNAPAPQPDDQQAFARALFDADDHVWRGGIPNKQGCFFIPAVLDASIQPDTWQWEKGLGIGSKQLARCPILFAELDEGTLPQQQARLDKLVSQGLPHPTAIAFSGSKSLHFFWRLDDPGFEPTDPTRLHLQLALIAALGSDPRIKDPARKMRWGGWTAPPDEPDYQQTLRHIGPRIPRQQMLDWLASTDTPPPTAKDTSRASLRLRKDVDFLTIPDLVDIADDPPTSRTRLHCPFHDDGTPSAFVDSTDRGRLYLCCSSCETTWFHAPTMPFSNSDKGIPTKTFYNACVLLEHDPIYKARTQYDQRHRRILFDGEPLKDQAIHRLRRYALDTYSWDPTEKHLADAMLYVAHENPINHLIDYLDGLQWDGVPRLDTFLHRATGCPDTPLTRAYSRCTFIAATARAKEPGCKVDTCLLLIGTQGAGKSSLFHAVAPEWFSDAPLDLSSKDAYAVLAKSWIHEISELSSFNRADTARVKHFLSVRVDTYRSPYARTAEDHPRHTLIVATTNDYTPLKDPTGSRRFWPVRVGDRIDLNYASAVRHQLWAEAVQAYNRGESWWLPEHLDDERNTEAEGYTAGDPREERILAWLDEAPKTFKLGDVMAKALRVYDYGQAAKQRSYVDEALRKAGCKRIGKYLWKRP